MPRAALRTHTNDPIPFLIYHKQGEVEGVDGWSEKTAAETGLFISEGHTLMEKFLGE